MDSNKGYTLIELIVVIILISSFVSLASGSIVILFNRGFQVILEQSVSRSNANRIYTAISRDLRNIKDIASILTANNNIIAFNDIEDNTISYYPENQKIQKSINGTSYQFAENAHALNFIYYDASNNVLSEPMTGNGISTNIRTIESEIAIGENISHITINMRVRPRNIRG
ncbi:MAG: hypothetical protein A2X42_12490 [Candidatus Margulisbacteria bacterium GWF2_38_17]|nr:MAG: hypothetical protein A2X43_08475 [Candidatus Margulisbacteria bacterium GWD2_39_127]OGI05084.1 MAG: hypothetical protein A2X42_12490 [Candidatus Margulisbacteria bacterium GWF2_38_17]OGI09214.1 MAG: hypothetical protein A2X41_01400 [Candidatus Margulisbacteria bacterium GWE2_39_32]